MTATGITLPIKIVYAQARQPQADRIGFVGAWREHGAVAMQCADYFGEVTRYVHADAFATVVNDAGEERSYDGIGEIAFPSLDAVRIANASHSREQIVVPHGRRIFGSPHPISMIVEEHRAWESRPAAAKIYTFARRPVASTREQFTTDWASACQRWSADQQVRGTIQSYARDIPVDPDAEFDGVEEITFDTPSEARAAFVAGRMPVTSFGLGGSVSVLTQQVVLLDRAAFAHFDTADLSVTEQP